MRSVYWFGYGVEPEALRRRGDSAKLSESMHMLRDGQAFIELLGALPAPLKVCGSLLGLPHDVFALDPAAMPKLDSTSLGNRPNMDAWRV